MPDETERASVEKPAFWLRLIPMIIYAISLWLAFHLLLLIAAVQFIWNAINDEPNEHLSKFGDSLSKWMKSVAKFMTYRSEDKPFPWTQWPDADEVPDLSSEPAEQPEPAPKPAATATRTTAKSTAKPKASAKPKAPAKPKTPAKPRAKPKPKTE